MTFTIEKFNSLQDQQNYWRELVGADVNSRTTANPNENSNVSSIANTNAKANSNASSSFRCFPYHGLGHALVDLLYGLKLFWPTKKNLLITPFGSPILNPAVHSFVKDGHTLIKRNAGMEFPEIPKDLLTAVMVRDHCFTSEIITSDEDLKVLNEKRIPHIEIQHAWGWGERAQLPHPFGAQIRVIDAQKAIVVVGNRFRFMNHSAHLMDWSGLNWSKEVGECKINSVEDQNWLKAIEFRIQHEQKDLIGLSFIDKLFDRLVLMPKGIHGEFFLETLLEELKESALRVPGFETRCEATNLSRWEGMFSWDWWGPTKLSEEEQRSLVVLSVAWMKKLNVNFEIINKVYLKCLQECRVAG